MPRDVAAPLAADIDQLHTRPTYLVHFKGGLDLRLSSGVGINALGFTWLGGLIRMNGVSESGTFIRFSNANIASLGLVLGGSLDEVSTDIYIHYPNGVQKYFSGIAQQSSGTETETTLEVSNRRVQVVPDVRMAPPLFNHPPIPGSSIRSGDSIIRVQ